MEIDESPEVQVGDDVAVDDHKRVINTSVDGSEPDGARRIERLRLHGVDKAYASGIPVGIGLLERIGQVPQRQNGLVHSMGPQMRQHPFDHRHANDRQHLLRYGQGQGTEPSTFASNEDNRLH